MPVRKIPRNYRNITGVFSSSKSIGNSEFESNLEKDFLSLLEFDSNVEKFEVQPIKITYLANNCNRSYTPDVLVYYKNKVKPFLYEVKYRNDIKENWNIYRPKFKAAIHYARTSNLHFSIITEKEIQTPFLKNVKFLLKYKQPINDIRVNSIIRLITELRETTPETVIVALANDTYNRIEMIYLIWQLLANGQIQADLLIPLTMKTRIWLS